MFRMNMSGFLKGMYSEFLNHCNCEYITSCEHDALTGPPSDVDGNPLHYFDRTEKAFRALQKLVLDDKWLLSMKG